MNRRQWNGELILPLSPEGCEASINELDRLAKEATEGRKYQLVSGIFTDHDKRALFFHELDSFNPQPGDDYDAVVKALVAAFSVAGYVNVPADLKHHIPEKEEAQDTAAPQEKVDDTTIPEERQGIDFGNLPTNPDDDPYA